MVFRGILPEAPSFGTQLARGLGAGIGKGLSGGTEHLAKLQQENLKRGRLFNDISEEDLIAAGVDPEDAKLYSKFTVGGKTQLAKDILEARKRGGGGFDGDVKKTELESAEPSEARPEKEFDLDRELSDVIRSQDIGVTPAEKVKRGAERYKTGLPIAQDAHKKLQTFAHNKTNLGELQKLRKTGNLPKGLGRLNVDKDGNLRLPFLASKESQRFVKIINEFASGAKDTYGSRVTNFDLTQYLKQFPNLLNSEEGINDLIEHLGIVNDINSVFYKNLSNIYKKAGGVRNIDSDVATSLAEKMSEKQTEKLKEKFDKIGLSDQLPSAHKNKGERFVDEETGDVYESDGKSWIKTAAQ